MRSGWRCGIAFPKVNIRMDSHPPSDPSQEQMEAKGLLVFRLDSWQPSESPMFLFSWNSSSCNKGGDPFLFLYAPYLGSGLPRGSRNRRASPGSRANTKTSCGLAPATCGTAVMVSEIFGSWLRLWVGCLVCLNTS